MLDKWFDQLQDREGCWAEKYDLREKLFGRADVAPLWVADMDFATPPFVLEAIQQRCQQYPVLGYTEIPTSLAQVVCAWQLRQHQWEVNAESVVWLSGVVSGIYLSIQAFTQPDDAVMVFTPVYAPFMRSVRHLGRRLVEQPMMIDDQFRYQLDFTAIEQSIITEQIKLLLLSNPHNPSGRVWTKGELQQLADICLRYGVKVVSDEVWSDLLLDSSAKHTPLASLSADIAHQTITLNAPSKTFNLAALHTAYALIPNPQLRQALVRQHQQTRAGEAGLFGLVALQSAYSDAGRGWLTALQNYLRHNLDWVDHYVREHWGVQTMRPEASYLLWMRFDGFVSQDDLMRHCVHELGLGLSNGTQFGDAGKGFMRLNFALSKDQLVKVLAKQNNVL